MSHHAPLPDNGRNQASAVLEKDSSAELTLIPKLIGGEDPKGFSERDSYWFMKNCLGFLSLVLSSFSIGS